MAGTLPGVEAARIRRLHHSNGSGRISSTTTATTNTRRSSFCLYATSYHEFRISSPSSMERNHMSFVGCDDERLESAVREAKERLDQRLHNHWKSAIKRKLICGGEAKVTGQFTK